MLLQLLGAAAMLAGGTWALGPWFLLCAGVVLLVVPELLERAGDLTAADEVEAVRDAAPWPRPTLPDPGMPERKRRRRAS